MLQLTFICFFSNWHHHFSNLHHHYSNLDDFLNLHHHRGLYTLICADDFLGELVHSLDDDRMRLPIFFQTGADCVIGAINRVIPLHPLSAPLWPIFSNNINLIKKSVLYIKIKSISTCHDFCLLKEIKAG